MYYSVLLYGSLLFQQHWRNWNSIAALFARFGDKKKQSCTGLCGLKSNQPTCDVTIVQDFLRFKKCAIQCIFISWWLLWTSRSRSVKSLLFFEWWLFHPKWFYFSLPKHTPNLTKLGIYITPAKKCHYLLSSSISSPRWCYNQGKCVLAYNSHILCRTFKNLISIRSLSYAESSDTCHAHFRIPDFFCKLVKFRKPTFSNSSQAISPISTKLCTRLLWTHSY